MDGITVLKNNPRQLNTQVVTNLLILQNVLISKHAQPSLYVPSNPDITVLI